MTEAKHRKSPWKRGKFSKKEFLICADGQGSSKAHVKASSSEDADFIILATSLHAELVAALEDTIRMLTAVQFSAGLGRKQLERVEKARAILRQAKQP